MAHPRRHGRREIRFPVAVESPAKPGRVGVARNVSVGGLLLATPSRFAAGQRVRIRFRPRADGPHLDIPGTVVRSQHDPSADWLSRLVAIQFDREVSERRVDELEHSYTLFR